MRPLHDPGGSFKLDLDSLIYALAEIKPLTLLCTQLPNSTGLLCSDQQGRWNLLSLAVNKS